LVPSGERQKSLRRAAALWDALQAAGADRRSIVVAFGGGVIGDLAGFAAAAYMRGVAYVQIPTTLLAQVDSSVGGKVAVNHPAAKNLIGAFHQPRLVLADAAVLRTLRARDYRSGLAEVVKHAALADAEMFAWLETDIRAVVERDPSAIARMVRRSCEIKADVVRSDERESGLRAVLNFGHTVGHALESVVGYRALRHGEGVAIGMVAAARIGQHLGTCSQEVGDRLASLLEALRLPTRIPGTPTAAILDAMRSDKKVVAGAPRFVLPRAIGRVEAGRGVPPETVRRVLIELGASASGEE
jgi:3-dehydroquinate synthase